jgi:hypothetical protein
VQRGCNFPPNDTRANTGDIIELPDPVAAELLRIGAVVPLADAERGAPKTKKPAAATAADAAPESGSAAPAAAAAAAGGEQ